MSGFWGVLAMAALLGIASFAVGILPLSFTFSKSTLARLSTFGTGLLLGAALGVIIPEGLEAVSSSTSHVPTSKVALSLLSGFTFMLVVEQLSPHAHSQSPRTSFTLPSSSVDPAKNTAEHAADVQFDVELGELERAEGLAFDSPNVPASAPIDTADSESKKRAFPLTLGLVMHALADGLALGSSAISSESVFPSDLSLIVFLAIIVHKAPTALALTTSLLSTSLSRVECRKHVLIFSASTPVGAIVSYGLLSLLGAGSGDGWTGVALLFSGGTFLYVATVLQPVSNGSSVENIGSKARIMFIVLGMFVPFIIGSVFGHGHE